MRVFRARDIACDTVADQDRFLAGKIRNSLEAPCKIARVGLVKTDVLRDENAVEMRFDIRACKARDLRVVKAVGHKIKTVFPVKRGQCFKRSRHIKFSLSERGFIKVGDLFRDDLASQFGKKKPKPLFPQRRAVDLALFEPFPSGKIQLGVAPDGDYGVGRIPREEL